MIKTKRRLFLTTILAIISAFFVLFGFITYKREKVTVSAESSTAYFTPGASIGKDMSTADQMRFRLNISSPSQVQSIKIQVNPYKNCSFSESFYAMCNYVTSNGEAGIRFESGVTIYNIALHVDPQIEYGITAYITTESGNVETVESDKRSVAYVLSKMKEAGDSAYENASKLHKAYMDSVSSSYSTGTAGKFSVNSAASTLSPDGTVRVSVNLSESDISYLGSVGEPTVTTEELLEDSVFRKYEKLSLSELQATCLPFYRMYVKTEIKKERSLYVIAESDLSHYDLTGEGLSSDTWESIFGGSSESSDYLAFSGAYGTLLSFSDNGTTIIEIPAEKIINSATMNYYAVIVERTYTEYILQRYDIKWGKENTLRWEKSVGWGSDCNAIKFSENYFSLSKKTWANDILSESDIGNLSENELKGYKSIAGSFVSTEQTPVTIKYKSLQSGGEYIVDKTSVFNVNSLYAQNMNSVVNSMYTLGMFRQLSDFNVVRKNTYFDKDNLERQAGERIIRQATGYKYEYDSTNGKGTLIIEYSGFNYKDVMITLQNNDAESHLTKDFYTANATQANGKITLVFNYDDLEMWGKNNCGWLFRLQKDNFTITNNSGGKVSVVNDGNARTLTLTCAEENENSLGEVSLRAVSEIVEDEPYSMTYRYKIIEDSAGELIESTRTSSPVEKKYSDLLAMSYDNFMTDYGNAATENLLPATLAGTNYCKAIDYRKAYDTENHTCEITLIYEYRSVFKVTDNQDENFYKFLPASETSLSYAGEYFCINDYEGYRVSKIESGDTSFARVTPNAERPDDWKNARIDILCRIGDGNVIPISITYTDKYKVRVEHLQNFVSTAKDGKQEASGVAEKKITEKEVTIDMFSNIYSPTENELKKFLNFTDLRVIGKFGAPDLEKTVVTFSDDIYTIKLSYAYAAVKVQQADGSYEEVKVPMSSYAEWTKSFGKDWSVLFLNTEEKVIFTDTVTVKPENVYGYFFVSVFKEQVKNLDMLFAGYASDGCKTFYQYKEVQGSAFYKFMANNPALLPVVGGGVGAITGLIVGHPIKGTAAGVAGGAGVYYSIMSVAEMANDENGTYYSYFSFLDGTSELPYASNSKADGFSDNDSAAKNTVENVVDDVKNFFKKLWNNDNEFTKFLKIVLGLFAFYLIFSIVLKIIAAVIRFFRKTKK